MSEPCRFDQNISKGGDGKKHFCWQKMKHVVDLFFKKVVYGFNTLYLLPIPTNFLLIFFFSEACRCRFDQNISKGGDGKNTFVGRR